VTSGEPPEFTADTSPRDALRAALGWLAEVVPDVRAVLSQSALRRSRGPMSVRVRLQSSTWSRRGTGTWVSLYVSVWDRAFGTWRATHRDLTWCTGELIHGTGRIGPDLQLFGSEPGYRTLADLPEVIETAWLPALDVFESPERAAREFDPGSTGAFSCMEWLVFRGDVGSARLLLERYLDAHPLARDRIDAGRAAGPPPAGTPIRDELTERWAPALETLGILAPGEPLPGVPPEVLPEPEDAAAELGRLLGGLGRVTPL